MSKRLMKKYPPEKEGYSIVMHLDPHRIEEVIWPATRTKLARMKLQHVVLGYSYKKTKPFLPIFSEDYMIRAITKEIRRGKKK